MKKNAYIPFNSAESASLKDPKTILAKNVYIRLVEFINLAVEKIKTETPSNFNDSRSHKAISIDGARGTGKTSVLVNLKSYIRENNHNLLNDIHILEPIDPTLLEDGESLFLHIIVAAILHDDEIKKAQSNCFDKSRYFSQCLEELASGLESIDLQKELHGMDKIRSLYGNKHLAKCVEKFFCASLTLLDKKLFILPIDDVDTSLNNAFENLEILRRYLTTPYILPIVSGDRQLYDEVCWRDFHGRLISDSTYEKNKAAILAKDLALEYQRKILPLPRRLNMPEVDSYWKNNEVKLGSEDGIPLSNFIAWLNIFVAGPVNGSENSSVELPIPSIRALTQLVNHCGQIIPELPKEIKKATTPLEVKQHWQMPNIHKSVLDEFHSNYQLIKKDKNNIYRNFRSDYENSILESEFSDEIYFPQRIKISQEWTDRLSDYFFFEPDGGVIYLILKAKKNWHEWKKSSIRNDSLLSTPLFQPLYHNNREFNLFEKNENLSEWKFKFENRLPNNWLERIEKQHTILPYPIAEIGINTALNWAYWEEISKKSIKDDVKEKSILLLSLLTERNFYTNAKQSLLLNIGRIFEIIITSLVAPLKINDLQRIKQKPPFFSTSALAPTKTVDIPTNNKDDNLDESNIMPEDLLFNIDLCMQSLCDEINKWYYKYNVNQLDISPWMVYKVFNKVFNQVANYNIEPNGMKDINVAFNLIGKVFYATWSAFGSFEKGEIFGLPEIIATTNINSVNNFEHNEHYLINIRPFCPTQRQLLNNDTDTLNRKTYGKETKSITYVLVEHPLRIWIEEILSITLKDKVIATKPHQMSKVKKEVIELLKLDKKNITRMTKNNIIEGMIKNNWTKEIYLKNLKILQEKYNKSNIIVPRFAAAGKELFFKEDEK